MKKITLFLMAALMMGTLFTACQKEESRPHSIRFYATVENNSKIFYDDSLQNLMWNFDETNSDLGEDCVWIIDENGTYSQFYPQPPEGYTGSYGPAAMFVNEDINADFDTECDSYIAVHGMDPQYYDNVHHVFLMDYWNLAWMNFPMYAQSSSTDPTLLHFKHVFAYLKLRFPVHHEVYDDYEEYNQPVGISVTANKPIGGYFMINLDGNGNLNVSPIDQTYINQNSLDIPFWSGNQMYVYLDHEDDDVIDVDDDNDYFEYFFPIPAGDYDNLTITCSYPSRYYIERSLGAGNTLQLTRGSVTPITFTFREGEPIRRN